MIDNKLSQIPSGIEYDIFYFRITDNSGYISLINTCSIPRIASIVLNFRIEKTEFNDGKINNLEIPIKINYGKEIKTLDKGYDLLPLTNIIDLDDHYLITVPYMNCY